MADEYERARDLEAVRGEVLPRGRSLSGGELRTIFEVLADDERPIARRNACALVLLVGAGVRLGHNGSKVSSVMQLTRATMNRAPSGSCEH